jgi:endonuclease/exonuclease/phosphatase (EEP) superfamily protein YafD
MSDIRKDRRVLVAAEFDRTLAILAFFTLLPSWLGLLGDLSWVLDLLAHFRWQYLFVAMLVLGWALWRRRRMLRAFAALTLLLNAVLVGSLAWHPEASRGAVAQGQPLRVLSLNVLMSNPDKQAVLDYLVAADADVVFLTEVDDAWMDGLAPLLSRYPHRVIAARRDNFGVALLSRLPWSDAGVLYLGDGGLPSIEARLQLQDRELLLVGTHAMPPMGGVSARLRDGQLQALADHVKQAGLPALAVGDFNATPWSSGLRHATSAGLGYRSLQPPWSPTWRARSVFAIPIDQALCTSPLVIVDRKVGPDVGSDHRGLAIAVGWSR